MTKVTKTDKSTGDPYIGQRVGDSYVITKWLGAGGMGSVYVAESSKIGGQLAAVKVLTTKSDDAIARFHAEAFAAGRVNDKFSIVGILDCGQLATGQHYILLEYCDGGSLDALLAERGGVPLSFDHILSIMAPVCAALIAAHAANLVHRDIKPANILFVKDGKLLRARLGDFGIVKLRDHTRLLLTGRNAIMGTAGYMSPEQCVDTAEVDARSDIYSVGCVLYELVTGRLPYVGGIRELIQQTAGNAPIVSPTMLRRDLPPEWERAIMHSLAFRREDRIASALELIRMLAGGTPNGESLMGFFAPRLIADITIAPTAITISDAVGPAATLWSQANSAIQHRARRSKRRVLTMFSVGILIGILMTCSAGFMIFRRDRSSSANVSPPVSERDGSSAARTMLPEDAAIAPMGPTAASGNVGSDAAIQDAAIQDAAETIAASLDASTPQLAAASPIAAASEPIAQKPAMPATPVTPKRPSATHPAGSPTRPPERSPAPSGSSGAPQPSEATTSEAWLSIRVKGAFAEVSIDGDSPSTSPKRKRVRIGAHHVVMTGYPDGSETPQRKEFDVVVPAGKDETIIYKTW